MITLISGLPGAGKTAWAVSQLAELLSAGGVRPVYTLGIPGLTLHTLECPPVSEWTTLHPVPEDPSILEPRFVFPVGSVIVIDEAQKIFPVRTTGSRVPPHVGALDVHRHTGLDFWLISQTPSHIDSHVRRLVGRHVHLLASWSGRRLFEWPEAVDSSSTSTRAVAAKRPYKLPKAVFKLYTSSSLHVEQTHRRPLVLYGLAAAAVLAGLLAWRSYTSVRGHLAPVSSQVASAGQVVVDPALGTDNSMTRGTMSQPLTPDLFVPRISTRPESAPLYDGLRQVTDMPVIAGCVSWDVDPGCTCYTGQGTDAFIPEQQCRELIRKPQFNPFKVKREEREQAGQGPQDPSPTANATSQPAPSEQYAAASVEPSALPRGIRAHRPAPIPEPAPAPPAPAGGFRR